MFVPKLKLSSKGQPGFSMIEVLVAFVILSIGLLGVVNLQAVAKQSTYESVQRNRAVALADFMVERIRANPDGVAVYNRGLVNPLGGGVIAVAPNPSCIATSCTVNELANRDLWEWEQKMDGSNVTVAGTNAGGLISAQGCIVFTAAPDKARTGLLAVFVQWRGGNESSDAVQAGEMACGGANAGDDLRRRQVRVNTYILDDREL